MRAARVSPGGEILERISVRTDPDPGAALETLLSLADRLDGAGACAIGVGIPGRVDGWSGEILSGGFLDMSGIDLKRELAMAFGCPVTVANDCSMALIAEHRCGAAMGIGNAAMLTIGTGIGGALMEAGRIVNGRRCAGQLGHLVVNMGGRPCKCGQRGCVETESSGTALRRHLDEAGYGGQIRFEQVLALAEAGDERARGVMIAWAGPLRAAINTLSAAFDPDIVLLGGGMGQAACRAMDFLPPERCWYQVDTLPARLGDDAGVIGAGLAALDLVPKARGGRRLVMVNGVPASGKSSLAHALAERTGWPLLALDTIKEPFLELLDGVDRPFNRLLGRASYKAIFAAIGEAAEGSTFIVDAWFGFQPAEVLREHVEMAGIGEVVELWCHAPPEVIGERYAARLGSRLPGHPGAGYVPELIGLAGRAGPVGLGPVLDVDTTRPADAEAVIAWIAGAFDG